jgi:small GTP-binding protein
VIARKVCMLGSFAVGKTSLVRRFVESMFSETYQTTVGVKVDKKVLEVLGNPMTLVLWDIHGVEENEPLRRSYLRGAHGYLLVCDGTRGETLAQCLEIGGKARASIGEVPSLLLINKADIKEQWEIPAEVLDGLRGKGWRILETSARSGQNVEESFHLLATAMLGSIKPQPSSRLKEP